VANDTDKLVENEIAKFQGTWRQVAYERNGVPEPRHDEQGWQPRTTFEGNSFVVTIADGSTPIRGTFTLEPRQEPEGGRLHGHIRCWRGQDVLGDLLLRRRPNGVLRCRGRAPTSNSVPDEGGPGTSRKCPREYRRL